MKTRKETVELAAMLAMRMEHHNAGWIGRDTLKLCRIGSAANTNAVALCNGWIDQEKFDRKKASLLKSLKPIKELYKVEFSIGGDPRGYVLRMHNAGGLPVKGNTWGGDEDGYGI